MALTLPIVTEGIALDPKKHFVYLQRVTGDCEEVPKTLGAIRCFDSIFQIFNLADREESGAQILHTETASNHNCFAIFGDSPRNYADRKGI